MRYHINGVVELEVGMTVTVKSCRVYGEIEALTSRKEGVYDIPHIVIGGDVYRIYNKCTGACDVEIEFMPLKQFSARKATIMIRYSMDVYAISDNSPNGILKLDKDGLVDQISTHNISSVVLEIKYGCIFIHKFIGE